MRPASPEVPMIKDVMVWLDGGISDEVRLEAAAEIARRLDSRAVIGLLLNPVPAAVPATPDVVSAIAPSDLLEQAREAGDRTEARLAKRLSELNRPIEIRRFDVLSDEVANIAAREARSADTFVAVRPNGAMDPEDLVEGVLFGSGRHLYLIPETERPKVTFDRILIAWNGSREAARAMTEAMPYLHKADEVTVMVVTDDPPTEEEAIMGVDAVHHLRHHDIEATLHRVADSSGEVADKLMTEAARRRANLIVMGGYSHSRMRERLLGGVTYELMRGSAVPLLVAY
jgi:nucleotide-binding universal stress UspA family protein